MVALQHTPVPRRKHARFPDFQLDGIGQSGNTSHAKKLALPPIYYTHKREVVERNGLLVPVTPLTPKTRRRSCPNPRCPLPHRRRYFLHLPCCQHRRHARRHHCRNRRRNHFRTQRHAHGRPCIGSGNGRAQKTRLFLNRFFKRLLYISNPNNTATPSAPAVLFALLFLQISFNNKKLNQPSLQSDKQ